MPRGKRSVKRTSNEPDTHITAGNLFIKSKKWIFGYVLLILPEDVPQCREPGCPCHVQQYPSQHMNPGHLSPTTTTGSGAGCKTNFGGLFLGCIEADFLRTNTHFCNTFRALQDFRTFAPLQTKLLQKLQIVSTKCHQIFLSKDARCNWKKLRL